MQSKETKIQKALGTLSVYEVVARNQSKIPTDHFGYPIWTCSVVKAINAKAAKQKIRKMFPRLKGLWLLTTQLSPDEYNDDQVV